MSYKLNKTNGELLVDLVVTKKTFSFEKITAHEIIETITNIPITPWTGRLAFNTKANNDNSVVSILFRLLICIR